MLHKKSGPSSPTRTAPTPATKPNVDAIFAHAGDVDRQARERRSRALLRAAERLQPRYPDSAALALHWARGGGDR